MRRRRPGSGHGVHLLLALASLESATAPPAAAQTLDLLVRSGWVGDGTGNPAVRADVGIRDGVIVAVGDLSGEAVERTLDASGLCVASGFIYMHSHADRSLFAGGPELRRATNLVALGITTVVSGPDGRYPTWPLTATDGTHETIRIDWEAAIRFVGSHIKAKGPRTWGQSAIDVAAIQRAREEDVEVYLEQCPYETFRA